MHVKFIGLLPIVGKFDLCFIAIECQRHEALLNLAFQDSPGFWLLCPYDTDAMPPEVIEEAKRTHPYVVNGASNESEAYYGLDAIAQPFAAPLPAPPVDAVELRFDAAVLKALRRLAHEQAALARFSPEQSDDFALAVSELAANSIRHGGGTGVARLWREGGTLLCDVSDGGSLADPLAGRVRPAPGQAGGHGLWLVTQVCDLAQIRPLADGTTVRIHVRRRSP